MTDGSGSPDDGTIGAAITAPLRDVTTSFRDVIGPQNVLLEDELTDRYRHDWTGRFIAPSAVVLRPATTAEVSEIVNICRANHLAVVAQGGNTGLVGGSVPLSGEVVVSTERMTGIVDADRSTGHLTALAGTPLAVVQAAAVDMGWEYGVDIAARGSATIGGTVATNAGGLRVARYGDTRRQVVGIEMVAGTGEVISEMRGTLRNNVGYHLPSLVTGSEGTLGVLTRLRLRLVPRFTQRVTAFIRFDSRPNAANSAESLHRRLPDVESIEFFFDDGVELVQSVFGFASPFDQTDGGYLIVEVAANSDPMQELVLACAELDGVRNVAVAQDSTTRSKLWRFRELHTEAIATLGPVHKLDVAVPPGSLAEFVELVPQVVSGIAANARTWLFGHGGESAVHVNVTGLEPDDERVDEAVLGLVARMGGSISAEHGIGRAKQHLIGLAHNPPELALLGRIKNAFDPDGIMNPAVLL